MASPLTTPATKSALQIISSADLSPTEHLLLNHFIEGAVDPDLAAQYLISRIDFQHDPEFCLRRFKQDWKKLAARCWLMRLTRSASLTFPVTTCDPVPKRLDTLVRRRDHPSYSWPRNQLFERGPVLAAEPAYIVPPSLLQNLGSAEEVGDDTASR